MSLNWHQADIWAALMNVGFRVRPCENSTRYNRTRNFEACGHAQSKKMQKFLLRSALQPNQISFSHGLGPSRQAAFFGPTSLTGHCGHGWTCSLPRPVAIDPISEVEGASQQSRPCRFLQRGRGVTCHAADHAKGICFAGFAEALESQFPKSPKASRKCSPTTAPMLARPRKPRSCWAERDSSHLRAGQ
jgi:hypothetical protein